MSKDMDLFDAVKEYIIVNHENENINAHIKLYKDIIMNKVLLSDREKIDDLYSVQSSKKVKSKESLGSAHDIELETISVDTKDYEIIIGERISSNTSTVKIREDIENMLSIAKSEQESSGEKVLCNKVKLLEQVMDTIDNAKSHSTYRMLTIKANND